jgi:hypothetical protein
VSESLLAEAIRNMGAEDLLRAFENPKWGSGARALIRAELLLRLKVLTALGEMAPDVGSARRG